MSDEGRRDVKAMLAMLESDGPFDHTEAGGKPGGLLDLDYSGTKRIKLQADLATANAQIQKLISERSYLQGLTQKHLTYLLSTSSQAIVGLRNALDVFEKEMRSDGAKLQQMMHADALARHNNL